MGQVFKLKSVLIPKPASFLTHPGQKFLEGVCEISSRKTPLLLPFPAFPCAGAVGDVEELGGLLPEFIHRTLEAVDKEIGDSKTQASGPAVRLTSYGTLVGESLSSLDFRFCNVKWASSHVMVLGGPMKLPEDIHFTNIKCKTQWNWPEVKRLRLKAKHS